MTNGKGSVLRKNLKGIRECSCTGLYSYPSASYQNLSKSEKKPVEGNTKGRLKKHFWFSVGNNVDDGRVRMG